MSFGRLRALPRWKKLGDEARCEPAVYLFHRHVWAGALLDARWTLLPESRFSPYLGLGLGAFSSQRDGTDLGVQPTASFEAGISWWRLFAGARLLLPLSNRTTGLHAHDQPGLADPALLGQLGFRI